MAIRVLPVDVSSKIAAGEVIDRPASVVKELVENSLDAGATAISIEVRGGGVEYVRVSDNGAGIAFDEVELAVQRFATSKLSQARDLEAIPTLGFRGEALHSIAAVSTISLVTRSSSQESGIRLDIVDGEAVRKENQGVPTGTTVTVRHLFRNFPARRKFLRSTATESSRIHTLATRYALAYPEVRFHLSGDRFKAFSSPGSGDPLEAVKSVYGLDVAQAMLQLFDDSGDGDEPGPAISGVISPPSMNRANRSYMSLFVNRRWVQNRMLAYALEQAYHGFLKERRYPLAIVNIGLPYEDIDVNVHPAKAEVRFRHDNQVFGALQQTVRRALTTHSPVPEVGRFPTARPSPTARPHGVTFWPTKPFASADTSSSAHGQQSTTPFQLPTSQPEPLVPKKALPALRVLGQVQNTYVVAEGPDGMYLIDQHAAHERVVFEKVRAEASSQTANTQSLLEPVTVEPGLQQQELLVSQQDLLYRLGFRIEAFGAETFLLRGVPPLMVEGDPGQALLEILDLMAEGGGFEPWEERAAYSIACHGAIRAGKTLTHEEMVELTRQLEDCHQPNTCPHGRPTMMHLSSGHLEREFGRR